MSRIQHPETYDRIRHLSAFWQHFALHRRTCDFSGEGIISVFPQDCPYPVWKRSSWIAHTDRPSAEYSPTRPFFEQLWELFKKCPIPHMTGLSSENCDYCDDWWNSKDCYLCHSGLDCRDALYCYRCLKCSDCRYTVFSFHCELCNEVVDAHSCFHVICGVHLRQCTESAFLFDCRNCADCFMCWNLRNKQYCVENKQLTKEEYHRVRAQYDLQSRSTYTALSKKFFALIEQEGLWKATERDRCVDSTGSYIENLKNCTECFFVSDGEDCTRCIRATTLKDCIDAVGVWNCELVRNSVLIGETRTYDVAHSFHTTDCSMIEYCAACVRCKECFGCCSLVDKQYCIFNTQYSKEEYLLKVAAIKDQMKAEGIYGDFFPGYFAPCTYDESLAGFHFPLSPDAQRAAGFRVTSQALESTSQLTSAALLPDHLDELGKEWLQRPLYDEQAKKRISISAQDITLAKKLGVPAPTRFYLGIIKELFSLLYYDGALYTHHCAHCTKEVPSHFPKVTTRRVLCDSCYQEL